MGFILFIVLCVILYIPYRRTSDLAKRLEHIERYLKESTTAQKYSNKVLTDQGFVKSVEDKSVPAPVASHATHHTESPATPKPQVLHEAAEPQGVIESVVPDAVIRPATQQPQAKERVQVEQGPSIFDSLIEWLKVDWLMKVGGFLVILGVGWFVGYAFENKWISPKQRILLGLFTGIGVMALAYYRSKKHLTQGAVLLFLGASIAVLTLYADQALYNIFPARISLALMFVVACTLGVFAVLRKHRPLGYADVLLATVAPTLVATSFSFTELSTYYLVMVVGAIWVSTLTGWRDITLLSFGIVFFFGLPYLNTQYGADANTSLLFAFAFTAIYFAVSVLSMRVVKKAGLVDVCLALGTGLYLLLWVLSDASERWQSLILIVWALIFTIGARFAVHLGAGAGFLYSYVGVGVTYVGIATALEFDGSTLTLAFILEATLLVVLGHYLSQKENILPFISIPMLIPLSMSVENIMAPEWRDSILHEHAVVLVVILLALTGICVYLSYQIARLKETGTGILQTMKAIYMGILGLYSAVFVWLVTFALVAKDDWAILTWSIFFVVSVAIASQFSFGKELFYSYAFFSFILLINTPGTNITVAMSTVAYTLVTTAILLAGHQALRSDVAFSLLSLPILIPTLMSVESIVAPEWADGIMHMHAVVVGLLFLSFVTISVYVRQQIAHMSTGRESSLPMMKYIFMALTSLYAAVLIWLMTFALVKADNTAVYVWSVLFVLVSAVCTQFSFGRELFNSYAVSSLLLLSVTLGADIRPAIHTIAFIIVAATILPVGYYIVRKNSSLPLLSAPMLIPLFLSLESLFAPEWRTSVRHEHAVVVVLMILVLAGIGAGMTYLLHRAKENDREEAHILSIAAWALSGIYLMRLIWLMTHALIESADVATMITLFIYTVTGSLLYVASKMTDKVWQAKAGLTLLGFVIARLLVVDVWDMDLVGRMITFVVIGVVLIAVAWFVGNKRNQKESEEPVHHAGDEER